MKMNTKNTCTQLALFLLRLPLAAAHLIRNAGIRKTFRFVRFCLAYYIFVFRKETHRFPQVLLIAVTGKCNLACKECFIRDEKRRASIPTDDLKAILSEAEQNGTKLIGLTGGEPFTHPAIVSLIQEHPKLYFFVFTNALLIRDDTAHALSRLQNVILLVGIDGPSGSTAQRRGAGVYENLRKQFSLLTSNKIPFGITVMTTSKNIQDVTDIRWLKSIRALGSSFALFVQYTPSGRNIRNELLLDAQDMALLKECEISRTMKARMLPLSMHAIGSVCPFRSGKGLYISENGEFGTCPAIPFSNVPVSEKIADVFNSNTYFQELKRMQQGNTSCLFRSNIHAILGLVEKHAACSDYHADLYAALQEYDASAPQQTL